MLSWCIKKQCSKYQWLIHKEKYVTHEEKLDMMKRYERNNLHLYTYNSHSIIFWATSIFYHLHVQLSIQFYVALTRNHSLSLWVPSSSKKVGCHWTPFLSTFCHSNTFRITQAVSIRHINRNKWMHNTSSADILTCLPFSWHIFLLAHFSSDPNIPPLSTHFLVFLHVLQVGFLVGICLPCYELMAQLFPEAKPMKDGAL